MASNTDRSTAVTEAREWLASVTERVTQMVDPSARLTVLSPVIGEGQRMVERCAAVNNPDLIADLYLTLATAEVELAASGQSGTEGSLQRDAIDHCDLAVATAIGSQTTFVPAEILPWAMGTLSYARTRDPRGQERLLDARLSSYSRDLGRTLEQMEADRQHGSDTFAESAVLFAASNEVTDLADYRRVVGLAVEQAQEARRLLLSTGDFEIARLATDHIEAMQRALRGAAARVAAPPPPAAPQAAAVPAALVPPTTAAPEASRTRTPARRLPVTTMISVFGLVVAAVSAYLPWAKVGALTVTPLTPGAQFQFGRLLGRGGMDAYVLLGGAFLAAFLTVHGARGGTLSGLTRRLGGMLGGLLIPFTIGEVLYIVAQHGATLGTGAYVLIAGTVLTALAGMSGSRRAR